MGFPLSRRPGRVYLWNRPKEEAAAPAERIAAPRVRPVAAVRFPPPAGRVYLAPLARPPVTERTWPLRPIAPQHPAPEPAAVYGSGWLARPPETRTVALRPVVGQHPTPAPGRVHGRLWDVKTPVAERPQPLRKPLLTHIPSKYVIRASVHGRSWLGREPVGVRPQPLRQAFAQHPTPEPGRVHGTGWLGRLPVGERPQPLRTPVAAQVPVQAVAFAQVYGSGWLARTPVGERPRPRPRPVYGGVPDRLTRRPQALGRWLPKEQPAVVTERTWRSTPIRVSGNPPFLARAAAVYGLLWKLREPVVSRTWLVRPVRVAGWPPPLLGRSTLQGLPWRHQEQPPPPVEPPGKPGTRFRRRIAISPRPVELILEDVLLIPEIADRWREGVVPMAEPGVLSLSLGMVMRMRSPVTAWAPELGRVDAPLHAGGRARAGHAPRAARIWEEEDALLLGIEPVIE